MNCLGINLWNWVNGLGPECKGLPEKISAMGFTAIELPMTVSKPEEAFLNEVKSSGLQVSLCAALGSGRDISNFDYEVRQNTIKYLSECIETAEKLNCHILAGPLYAGGGKRHLLSSDDKKKEWDYAVNGLRILSAKAEQCGVRLALEPINRYRTSVVNTAWQGLDMIRDIGCKNVGIHFDTFHAGIEENNLTGALKEILEEKCLFHFHACANNRGAPGEGFFPWKEIFGLLKKYHYDGHITMETFALGGLDSGWILPENGPDEVAKIGIRNLKSYFGTEQTEEK